MKKAPRKKAPARCFSRVRRTGRNVVLIDVPVGRKAWSASFLLSSDRHHDNPKSRHDLELKHLQQARDRGAGVVDAGDIFCAMQGKGDPRGSKHDVRTENQRAAYFDSLVDTHAEFYGPYADLFAYLGKGNHETRILDRLETDLIERLARQLNADHGGNVVASGYGGWCVFRFLEGTKEIDRIKLRVYHGTGGGGRATKGVRAVTHRSAQWPDADIVLTGHIHESWLIEAPRERLDARGRITHAPQTHVCAPTYKDEYGDGYAGWHVETDKPPKPLGAWWLRFEREGNRIIHELAQAK